MLSFTGNPGLRPNFCFEPLKTKAEAIVFWLACQFSLKLYEGSSVLSGVWMRRVRRMSCLPHVP